MKVRSLVLLLMVVLFLSNAYATAWTRQNKMEYSVPEEMEKLFLLVPDAVSFEELAACPSDYVLRIWQETSSGNFIVKCATDRGFTHRNIVFLLVVSQEGKIVDLIMDDYPDTRQVGAYWLGTFEDQDSSLRDVTLVAGVTYSSSAIRQAVKEAFEDLQEFIRPSSVPLTAPRDHSLFHQQQLL